ncbi:shikimate dehydrogenase [Quadrisphaera sp. GCM10027208]|uniref:shikimate dehydrogenase n=1 Tax=Quadrisphaera sp. GCM10027208 TaxID=3273423 RepID=UPI0036147AF9
MGGPAGGRRAAVLGHPVAHSLSPALHRAAYAALGLDWTYDAVDVDVPDLPGFVRGLDDSWAGLSLTMPLKQAVVPLCSRLSPLAEALGVVNTVTFAADRSLVGDNTDVEGIVVALRSAVVSPVASAVVVGGGATAASAVAALREIGCSSTALVVRSVPRARPVVDAAERLGVEVRPTEWVGGVDLQADVVVSTVPAGVADVLVEAVPPAPGVLLDVVYSPWPTPLAAAWARAGGTVVSGLEMLLRQAAAQVRLMTGLEPPLDAMRAALPRHA